LKTDLDFARFAVFFLLNETTRFVQNNAVLYTLHQKKERPKQCHFERHCESSSSPGRVKQGKKKIFSSFVTATDSFQKDADPFQKDANHFPRVGGEVEGRQHSVRPVHMSPLFLPIKTGEQKKKRQRERGQRREITKKRRETTEKRRERAERIREKEQGKREEKERKKTEDEEEEEGEAPPATTVPPPRQQGCRRHQHRLDATAGQPSSLSSSTSFFSFCVFLSTVHVACKQWIGPL
jgi:hypothetical protein